MRKSKLKWKRVADDLRRRIRAEEFPDGKLPTTRDLVDDYDVGTGTIDRALLALQLSGVVIRKHGSGYYVRHVVLYERHLVSDTLDEHALALAGEVDERGLFERMTGAGDDVEVSTEYQHTPAPARVADLLAVTPGTVVLERTWIYTADGEPYQVARSYMPLDVATAAGLTGPDCERKGIGTQWQLIQQANVALGRRRLRIEARMPDPDETALLTILPGTPVFLRWAALYRADSGAPVEAGVTVVPADKVAWVLDIDLRERTAR